MTKEALTYSDSVIITDDNPRNEDPKKIRMEMTKNIREIDKKNIKEIADRKKAIQYSIKLLNLGKVNNERVIDLLINEFPGYIEPIKINSDYYQLWTYSTPVNHKKITKWFKTIINNLNKSHKNTLELSNMKMKK